MNTCAARSLLLECRTSGDGIVYGDIIEAVFLLEKRPDSHEKQTSKRNMIFLAKIHKTLCRLSLQMKDIKC